MVKHGGKKREKPRMRFFDPARKAIFLHLCIFDPSCVVIADVCQSYAPESPRTRALYLPSRVSMWRKPIKAVGTPPARIITCLDYYLAFSCTPLLCSVSFCIVLSSPVLPLFTSISGVVFASLLSSFLDDTPITFHDIYTRLFIYFSLVYLITVREVARTSLRQRVLGANPESGRASRSYPLTKRFVRDRALTFLTFVLPCICKGSGCCFGWDSIGRVFSQNVPFALVCGGRVRFRVAAFVSGAPPPSSS